MNGLITIGVFLYLLLVHYIADFILQTDKQAKGKSTSLKALTEHVATYTAAWIIGGSLFVDLLTEFNLLILFAAIIGVLHFITDYFTSKLVKKYFDKGNAHNAFVVIGFDQFLHFAQIFLTFWYVYL